jgi:glutamate N-acetyltransferase / amino-acid N-acetyltransferase
MEEVPGGVTAPVKFSANGVSCGIKRKKKDLALIVSDVPAEAAGMFTVNRFRAAPVILSSSYLRSGKKKAFIINSGNANAATGERGLRDARRISAEAAVRLGVSPRQVLVFSTGIIGKFLPVEKITKGLGPLVEGLGGDGSFRAAQAIMTTDTFIKEKAVSFSAGGADVRLGGIAKGSGMIAPDMATMLCFLTTDAAIEKDALYGALREAVGKSFNSITVDGDCSTNDSVCVMANGASGSRKITRGSAGYKKFKCALSFVCGELARMLVADGEGASKVVDVRVEGARSAADAKKVCFAVANSTLVKTAVSGENPNWGRILSAAGASGARLEPGKVSVSIGKTFVFREGSPVDFDRETADNEMKKDEITITLALGAGRGAWSVLTTDLSEDYVRINKEYS